MNRQKTAANVTPDSAVRVLIVDDHQMVREGIKLMLSPYDDIAVVGEADTAAAGLSAFESLQPDVTLLDLQLPDRSGLDVLQELQSRDDTSKVLVLTVHDDDDLVLAAVRAGARGYMLKHTSHEELARAIRAIARGDHFFGPDVVGALIQGEVRSHQPALTDREHDVLKLLVGGLTNRDIGDRLFLSPDTVKTHLGNIYRKLGVDGRTRAVVVAMRDKLVE